MRAAVAAIVAVGLMQIAWILVMAPFTGIDEFDHVFRAESVAGGHWSASDKSLPLEFGRGGLVPVRTSVVDAAQPACARLPYTAPFNCRAWRSLPNNQVEIASAASAYNPVYYALVGFPGRLLNGNGALYVMRAVTALICLALLGFAVGVTATWARSVWPFVAIVLAALPTSVYSSAIATPNGIEIASGMALWCAVIALYRLPPEESSSTWLYAGSGVAIALLVNMHTLGALWLLLTSVASVVLIGARRLAQVVRPRGMTQTIVACCTISSVIFEVLWVYIERTNTLGGPDSGLTTNVWTLMPREMALWPLQAIAVFPMRDDPAPVVVYAIGGLALSAFAVAGVKVFSKVPRVGLTWAFVVFASYGVPMTLTAISFSSTGLNWQGRYGMPFTVAVILLLGVMLDGPSPPRVSRILLDAGLAFWGAMNVVALVHVRNVLTDVPDLVSQTGWVSPHATVLVLLSLASVAAWRVMLGSDRHNVPAPPAAERTVVASVPT